MVNNRKSMKNSVLFWVLVTPVHTYYVHACIMMQVHLHLLCMYMYMYVYLLNVDPSRCKIRQGFVGGGVAQLVQGTLPP